MQIDIIIQNKLYHISTDDSTEITPPQAEKSTHNMSKPMHLNEFQIYCSTFAQINFT